MAARPRDDRASGELAGGADAILVELLATMHAEQIAQREILTDILRRLDAGRWPATGHGPRDDADAALVQTIAAAVGGRRFTAKELLAHGRVDPRLAAAIAATDTDTPRALGKLFQRLDGAPVQRPGARARGRESRRARVVRGASVTVAHSRRGTLHP